MKQVEEGLSIVAGLLGDGTEQWATFGMAHNSDDDWYQQHIESLVAQRDFADTILSRLTDDAGDTALLIVTLLVREALGAFECLLLNKTADQLTEVPAITDGLAAATKWLEGQSE